MMISKEPRYRSMLVSKVLIADQIRNNVYLKIDVQGVVCEVNSISKFQNEPEHTVFYNGLLTADVPLDSAAIGTFIPSIVQPLLEIGYRGRLLLWKNISLQELKVTPETEIDVL